MHSEIHSVQCKICSGTSDFLFKSSILNKYPVSYFRCTNCNFIQTEDAYWLQEAYSSAIASLDIGLVNRNIELSQFLEKIMLKHFNSSAKFIDYGGGYGLLVRMMRDLGFDFYRQDYFCENLFAKGFDITDIETKNNFEALCAFEVFEHLVNPLDEIKKMFEYSETIIFSTILQPDYSIKSAEDWWYFVPETGQHISFYTNKALSIIAEINDCILYSNNQNLHVLTRNNTLKNIFTNETNTSLSSRVLNRLCRYLQPKPAEKKISLLDSDFNRLRKMMQEKITERK